VVSTTVPPYAIVAGNPARVVRMRLPPERIERLLAVAWWDWPVELVSKHLRTIMGNDLDELERVAKTNGSLAG
jgi:virginiamycin A acetyltransferase